MAIKTVNNIQPIQGDASISRQPKAGNQINSDSKFRNLLDNSLSNLKFSGHALNRLSDRGVVMTNEKTERLMKAVDTAENKGSKDSLVLLDELAFVVSVKNRTVITACDMSGFKEGVFTKIDSTIFG